MAEDPQGQQLVIELWREGDDVPWGRVDIENPGGTEPPANIQIVVMANPTGRSLESWVELATSQPEVITVAGRGAIAYSATGLYESDVVLLPTPDNRAVVKISAGYADPRDPLRQVFQTVVSRLAFDSSAAIGKFNEIDYRPLQTLLAAGDWQRADLETRAILMQLAGSDDFFYPHIEPAGVANLPCEDLQILDALWSRYRDGRFGFRAQQMQWKAIPASALTQRA
ncbi:MAG: GUN4 domain-containing protein [Leptolyngbyaceae cyanobacterium T60_A2020_046]|nr:GUN4 domain-containing protein [Leptolyngbyaceae cyanobacterium T60_A2020_046]